MPRLSELADAPVRRHRQLRTGLTIGVGVIVVALVGVGIYGLVKDPSSPHPARIPTSVTAPPFMPSGHRLLPDLPRGLPKTSDSEAFARAAVRALFTWDTTSGIDSTGYEQPLIAAADPSGTDTPGLIHDLSNYIPSLDSWVQLRDYQTRQSITISRLYIPHQWQQTVAAAPGQVQDGVVGYTIEGTRHRAGLWLGRPVTSAHPVSFTMFLACPPATQQCALLRLSKLNDPLN